MKIAGRSIAPGRAEGPALVSRMPFSFVGGCDPETGEILEPESEVRGERLQGRTFAFPHGKGSTVGSYVVYGLSKRGAGPAAIVNEKADAVVATGAILAEVPMVDGIDIGGIATGDTVLVNGDRGELILRDVVSKPVVSVFLRRRGRLLVVRRGERVGSFRNRWSAISGFLERDEDARAGAIREVAEETGIRGVRFRAAGRTLVARDGRVGYVVHPFLFDVSTGRVRLDWENVEARWIRPEEIDALDTVPRLKDAMASVLHALGPKPRGAKPPGSRGTTR